MSDPSGVARAMQMFGMPQEEGWILQALCAQTDPEAFYPEQGSSPAAAKRVCLSCEVRIECLDTALSNDERFGVWGGMTHHERVRHHRRER